MTPIALDYWKTRALNDRKTDKLYFQTIHNTTYDMENKKVSVYIQEDYSKKYQFSLE